uniref:ATP synthase F0 subunit 8 n=1 Tax=Montagnia macrospora TaxID=2662032 RepID=A0A343UXS7_9FLOR|nr:ATP synthase F0 subunit 8 [Montagnia macrospora]AVK39484.1 ATP synthase F0 subunit 8 [Montagnia macrospora]
MPQLDFLIIFPQIFWMCVIFSSFYFLLTFVFLPKLILSLKLRQFILEENSRKVNAEVIEPSSKKTDSHFGLELKIRSLETNFENIKDLLESNVLFPSRNFDSKVTKATRFTMLFCDSLILKNIAFFPKVFK